MLSNRLPKMLFAVLALAAALPLVGVSAPASASPTGRPAGGVSEPTVTSVTPPNDSDNIGPKYIANGTHTCQSKSSIGHTCQVSGADFPSCEVATQVLTARDCCGNSEYGGVSIGFKLDSCQ